MRNFTMLLCVTALLLGGCTTPYQTRGNEVWQQLSKGRQQPNEVGQQTVSLADFEGSVSHQIAMEARSIERFSGSDSNSPFTIGIIELTDDGEVNPAQHRQVMDEVRTKLGEEKGALLVVFVHGWHHGCRTCDSHLS